MNGAATLSLSAGVWRISLADIGEWWAWPIEVTVRSGDFDAGIVPLELLRTGTLSGRFGFSEGLLAGLTEQARRVAAWAGAGPPAFSRMSARLRRDAGPKSWSREADAEIECQVRGWSGWACVLPANNAVDVELFVPDFAPHYLWDASVPDGDVLDIGRVVLAPGASVSGWVVGPDTLPLETAIVELLGLHGLHPLPEAPKGGVNALGFFQIRGAPEGSFHIAASTESARSNADMVEVEPQRESRLRFPLALATPAELRLSLMPPSGPAGDPWLVHLVSWTGAHGHVWADNAPASDGGQWAKAGLPAGEYYVNVRRADGSVWFSDKLVLESGEGTREVAILVAEVDGAVSLGGVPVRGRVEVSEKISGAKVTYVVDDEGRFSGVFPQFDPEDAVWDLSIRLTEPPSYLELTSVQPDTVGSRLVRFSLDVPDSRITGRIVDEAGNPRGGQVTVLPPSGGPGTYGISRTLADDKTGEFVVSGLEEGDYEVFATGEAPGDPPELLESSTLAVSANPTESPSPVTLVLARRPQLVGEVTTISGRPLAGARVAVRSAASPTRPYRPVHSDSMGRFSVDLPPGVRELLIDASAPGVGRRTFRAPLPPDLKLSVPIDTSGARLLLDNVDEPVLSVFLFHEGAYTGGADIAGWSRVHGEEVVDGRISVPLMNPGTYFACRFGAREEMMAAILTGAYSPDRCSGGELAPGGDLVIEVPSIAPAAARP